MDKSEIQKVLEELLVGKQVDTGNIIESITLAEDYGNKSGMFWLNLKDGMLFEYLTDYDITIEEIESDIYYLYFQSVDDIDNIEDTKNSLTYLLRTEYPVSGEFNQAEEYVKKLTEKYGIEKSIDLLENIFSRYFSGSDQNSYIDRDITIEQRVCILTNILHIISHLKFNEEDDETAYQKCIRIARRSLASMSTVVQEFALKCFENWDDINTVEMLELHTLPDWLNAYKDDIIKDIRESFVQKVIEKEKLESEYKAKLLQLYALGKMPKVTTRLNDDRISVIVNIEIPKDIIETEEDAIIIRDYYNGIINNTLKEIKEQMSPENLAIAEQMAKDVSEELKQRIQKNLD